MKAKTEKPKGSKKPAKGRRPERSMRSARAGARSGGSLERADLPAPPGGLSWEELGVLRETFLARITAPEHAMTLRAMARLFYLLVLEGAGHFPNQREAQVRVMLRAAALDIKGVASYLADRDHHDRDPHEAREELGLHVIADRAADSLAELASEMAEAAGEPPAEDRAWWSPPHGEGEAQARPAGG